MQQMTSFISSLLDIVADFLGSEPLCYFVYIFIICWLVKIIVSLFHEH